MNLTRIIMGMHVNTDMHADAHVKRPAFRKIIERYGQEYGDTLCMPLSLANTHPQTETHKLRTLHRVRKGCDVL